MDRKQDTRKYSRNRKLGNIRETGKTNFVLDLLIVFLKTKHERLPTLQIHVRHQCWESTNVKLKQADEGSRTRK
jgi:hypothetical protein